jgi:hypothetical protein
MTEHIQDRSLTRDLRGASDAQLSQVLKLIDAMPSRGTADALIEGLRPRLAKLRPERPLGLARVLFAPLDTLIVAPREWQPGSVTIPRSALSLIAHPVLASFPALRAKLEPTLKGALATDADTVVAVGGQLWPAAAPIIAKLGAPNNWRGQTGLPEAEWFELRDSVAAILARAVQIEAVVADMGGDNTLERLLASASSCRTPALVRLMRILLARHPRPGEVIALLSHFHEPAWRVAVEATLNNVAEAGFDLFERSAGESSEAAAARAMQLAAMLEAVDTPARHRAVQDVRTKVSAACQERLASVLQDGLVGTLVTARSRDDVFALERSARNAAKLEAASRALDPQSRAHALLRTAAATVAGVRAEGLDEVDRIRLIEILVGPEEAVAAAARVSAPAAPGMAVQW